MQINVNDVVLPVHEGDITSWQGGTAGEAAV